VKRWFLLLIALFLVGAACGSGDDSGAATTQALDAAARGDGEGGPFSGAGDEATATTFAASEQPAADSDSVIGTGGVQPVVQPTDIGRDIIFTAELTVAVTDVARAGEEATNAIAALGGFVFGQQTTGGPNPRSVLTFKVIPQNFQAALSRLGSIGELRTQNVTADDVTERVVDLESRIATAEASVTRLRGFLDGATDIETIAQLEAQLLDRETTLETLRGTLRTIRGQVDLATIFLTLTEAQSQPQLSVSVTAYPGDDDAGASCPGSLDSRVEKGGALTLCYELFNTGDIDLTDFTFRDPVLDIEIGDLILVFGDLTSPMEPGQSIALAAQVNPERNLRTATRITATPINADGVKIEGRDVSNTSTFFVDVFDPGGLPGFADGVKATWGFLANVWGVLLIMAGVLLPVLPLIGAALAYVLWRRRQETETRGGTGPTSDDIEPKETADVAASAEAADGEAAEED